MAYQRWIADKIREYGVDVVEVDGWEKRGKASFDPKLTVVHHTAAPITESPTPSMNVVVNGRSGLPGPLCHVLIGRDAKAYMIAAGKANHAGRGSWQGISGNTNCFGIETEHVGTSAEPWRPIVLDTFYRVAAALTDGLETTTDMVCAHKEWAPTRKIDPYGLDMNHFRTQVARIIDNPNIYKDDDMVQDIIGFHTAYLGLIPGTPEWNTDVVKSVNYHLWRLATNQKTLEEIRQDFQTTAGI